MLSAQNPSVSTTHEEPLAGSSSGASVSSRPTPPEPIQITSAAPPTVDENGNILLDFLDDEEFMAFSFDE